MSVQAAIALVAGLLFGAGLALSGMADPARVRAFLDLGGHWDPTLAFVMAGALLPMAMAWRFEARRSAPLAADSFHVPATTPVTARLVVGALIFGVGWGVAGLCPGPALAVMALAPEKALPFVGAMIVGFGLYSACDRFLASPPRARLHAAAGGKVARHVQGRGRRRASPDS